jgi:hypothetical protein
VGSIQWAESDETADELGRGNGENLAIRRRCWEKRERAPLNPERIFIGILWWFRKAWRRPRIPFARSGFEDIGMTSLD